MVQKSDNLTRKKKEGGGGDGNPVQDNRIRGFHIRGVRRMKDGGARCEI